MGMVSDRCRKPMATRFDKFAFVHSGSFFPPTLPFSKGFNTVDEVVVHPLRVALPVNNLLTVIQMHRTR